MQTYGVRFAAELKKMIEARLEKIGGNLVAGTAVKTLEDYRYHTGMARAYNDVLDCFDDVVKNIEEGN